MQEGISVGEEGARQALVLEIHDHVLSSRDASSSSSQQRADHLSLYPAAWKYST